MRKSHLMFVLVLVTLAATVFWGCGAQGIQGESAQVPAGYDFKFPFDGDRAFTDLVKQTEFGPRNPGSVGHAKCLEWIKGEAAKTADKVFTQRFRQTFDGKPYDFTNVFAVYGEGAEDWVLLCAHWDTRPFAEHDPDPEKRGKPILGANDGASGVAVLLELGRLFKENPPPFGVVIIFFDGEDFGMTIEDMLLGSTEFAGKWREVMAPVTDEFEYGILLDMVGAKTLSIPREQFSQRAAPWLMDEIWRHAREAGLQEYFPDERGKAIQDDHIPLIEHGIPTVNLISFDDYVYWHTQEDTPDKCSPHSLKVVGEVVARTVYSGFKRPR